MNTHDVWYDVGPGTSLLKLQKRLEQDFTHSIIPYLNKIKDREDVINRLITEGSNYGILLIAQIKTLYHNGHPKRAQDLLAQSYRGANDTMKGWLDDLKRELSQ